MLVAQVAITIIILVLMLYLLIREIFDPLKIFVLVVTLFLVMGTITIDEAVAGFSNKGVLAVAALFIIAGTVEQSSYFRQLTKFDDLSGDNFKPVKLYSLTAGLSAFLNNTPIVSIFIPITKKISDKTGISESKLLMPISYVSILGGMLTLIGTSTNLVVSGLMVEMGLEPLGFFEITKVSIIGVVLGLIYINFTYNRLLPDNSDKLENSKNITNEHFVRFVVKSNSSIIGKTIVGANLRSLSGVYLAEIERNKNRIFPINPSEIIKEDDVLVFAGQTAKIDELRSIDNLVLEPDEDINTNYFNYDNTVILETVLTQHIGKPNQTIKQLRFRERYNAVVIGIIRNGQCINEKIGSIQPKLGDIFLIIADKGSKKLIENEKSFTLINSEDRSKIEHTRKSYYPFIAFLATVLITVIFGVDILYSAFIGISFLLLTNTVQVKDALNMIDYKTVILIAMTFAIGKAVTNSGTATFIAEGLEPLISNLSPIIVMLLIFMVTVLFTTVITNNAAAILVVPIVFEITNVSMYDPRPLLLITAVAASCAFLSPYAYQTNTMVYGAGGYKFGDFAKFGFPLVIIMALSSVFSAYLLFF